MFGFEKKYIPLCKRFMQRFTCRLVRVQASEGS